MTPNELIGHVGYHRIADLVVEATGRSNGEALRIVLDMLDPEHVGAIVKAIDGDADLRSKVCIRIKESIARAAQIDLAYHTNETEVWFRNHGPVNNEPALLIATDGDDQRESLEELTRLTAHDIKGAAQTWVDLSARALLIDDVQRKVWAKALEGLALARNVSLQQFARFVSATHEHVANDGEPLLNALGQALPHLRLPCDSTAFVSTKATQLGQAGAWRRRFEQLFADRLCLLTKHQKTGQHIDPEDLQRQCDQLRDSAAIPPEHVGVFQRFIDAPAEWGAEAQALADLEWEAHHVSDFFSGIKRAQDRNLATLTLSHFTDEGLPLTDEDADYLKVLQSRRSFKESDDPTDRDFYERHLSEIGQNQKLKVKWDTYVYGTAVTCTDFIDGIVAAMARLCARVNDWSVSKRLEIAVHGKGDRYYRELNADVATLFSMRYRGLKVLLGPQATLDLGRLDDYPAFLAAQREKGHKRGASMSRAATTIRFDVKLLTDVGDLLVQLHWTGSPISVAVNLADDLKRLANDPLLTLSVERNRVGRKGEAQRLTLSNYQSFEPSFGQDAGSLVPREDSLKPWRRDWITALDRTVERSAISSAAGAAIKRKFGVFDESYRTALEAARRGAIGDASITAQAEAYGELLNELAPLLSSDMDVPRKHLVEPILALGVVQVQDQIPSAVVTPWHPLRLATAAVRARRVGSFVSYLLEAGSVDFGDLPLFFRDFREQLSHPHYPEVVLGYREQSPSLLVVTDTRDDYSLAEEPHPIDDVWRSDSDPNEAAQCVDDIVGRYLSLQPHEHANLSVALYNCESAGLPIATIEALAKRQEDDVHCHVVLRHDDNTVLRRVYSELLEHADADPDALVASETSRNFMANLRVGIQVETPVLAGPRDARAVDIAFLDDVISRRAAVKYQPAPNTQSPPALLTHVPGHWSYRLPVSAEQVRAQRYLACPEQPACSLEQLRATLSVVDPLPGAAPYRLPVRELAFSDPKAQLLLKDVHNLAEWVVNRDDLLEPDQLRNLGISIIRYRRDTTHGRNLIVSSTSQSGMLLALVQRRLDALQLGLLDADIKRLAERLVADASRISGEIALRATKRGTFAGELIGVVLSHALVREELDARAPQAWYFLDDFAGWLGQREGGIADLMVLSPVRIDGKAALVIRVTEAKYVDDAQAGEMCKKSRSQLQNTVSRIRQALFGNPGRLDRDLWLARLSEFLVQASHSAPQMQEFQGLQRAVRQGEASIDLRGYSHIFVSGPLSPAGRSGSEELPKECGPHALQELFNVTAVRELLLRYFKDQPLNDVRASLPRDGVPVSPLDWTIPSFEQPAARPAWLSAAAVSGKSTDGKDQSETSSVGPSPTKRKSQAIETTAETMPATITSSQHSTEEHSDRRNESNSFLGLLEERGSAASPPEDSAWLAATVVKLRQALTSYNLQAKVVGSRLTPNAALVRLQGSDRLQVKDIDSRRSQLLTSHGLNVISVSARPLEIVVSIERPQREVVSLWNVWKSIGRSGPTGELNLRLLVGLREIDGEPLYLNLGEPGEGVPAHAPHTLVAGSTGSGKSVLIQNLLLDLAISNSPEQVHIYIIDPKMGVDYFALEALPHLIGGLVIDQTRALEVLEQLVAEMDRRYVLFRDRKVNKLAAYNSKIAPAERLPALFVVHDEFAEWMLTDTYRDAVASIVSRLSVKARAAGIHLLFAAQRPDNTVMPMQLRDNLGNRLVLRVEGEGTSEIALGARGAERLLGRGHVAARLPGEADQLLFGQVPFLSSDDAVTVVASIEGSAC
jgi:S-DNA-T family DNA segregation ATPase FtsK/SpoIIIE